MDKINDCKSYTYAKILWDYHKLNQNISKSDIILGFGSHDLNVAQKCAELYLNKFADLIIFTGGLGKLTKDLWDISEAEKFRQIAIDLGVPKDKILIETNSTNTGENIYLSKKLLKDNNLNPKNFIFVDKPYRERRTFATLKKQWEDINISVTSPDYDFDDYINFYSGKPVYNKNINSEILNSLSQISVDEFINIMVGDLQRIELYSDLGFQIRQEIPEDVYLAYNKLIDMGFDKHLY